MSSVEGVTLQIVKKINCAKIQQFIYEKKETTRSEIAHSLVLSLPTITKHLNDLENAGLIICQGLADSTGGRKAQKIKFNATAKISIGVEILKDYVRTSAVDLYGNVLDETIISVLFTDAPGYHQNLCQSINDFIDQLPYQRSDILGVGIAVQGLVSSDQTTLVYGKILNATGMDISKYKYRLGLPCILFHDAEAAANAEMWFLPQVENAIYLSLNRNLGSAVILNHAIQNGINRIGGTLEHVCLHPDGKPCYCGKKGCVDSYCSAATVLDESGLSLDQFFYRLRNGDSNCRSIWECYLENLSLLIANTRHIIDTDFIIGGLLSKYLTNEDYTQLQEMVLSKCPFIAPNLTLYRGKTDGRATVIGAALYYIRMFLSE